MKQKDIILIVVVIFISGVVSFFVTNMIFSSKVDKKTQVEVVEAISSKFTEPDKRYFNPNSINPTVPVKIGDSSNNQPF